jgi:hypothetical protein
MSTHEDTSSLTGDELARRREARAASESEDTAERPLRERVREEARRVARRHAAANRARQRAGGPPPQPFGTDGAA